MEAEGVECGIVRAGHGSVLSGFRCAQGPLAGSQRGATTAIVCYVETFDFILSDGAVAMKVSDILRVKGNTLFTVSPDQPLTEAITTMAEHDIGSLVVMDLGELTGMLTSAR
jgi:predicted transcriptional regulator